MCTVSPTPSNHNPTAAIAFCCSLFAHVLSKFQDIFHLTPGNVDQQNGKHGKEGTKEEVDEDELSDEEEEETKRAKLRRRKIGSGSSDQEFSEEEIFLDSDSEQDSEEEVLSDSGFHSGPPGPAASG